MIWNFAFHPPSRHSLWSSMGHVDAFGQVASGAWVFLYPERENLHVLTANDAKTFDRLVADHMRSGDVLTFHKRRELRVPILSPYSCVALCGHLSGIRAFTPNGLKRKLLQNGATYFHEKRFEFI